MPRTKKASTARSPKDALEARRTRSRRPKDAVCQRAPGPGYYRPVSFTDISMRPACGVHYREPRGAQRRMPDAKIITPGPGAYNPLKPFGYKSFTTNIDAFCARDKHMDIVNIRAMNAWSPGPASYLPHYGASSQKTNGVSVRIAGAVHNCHELAKGGASPGPASYNLDGQLTMTKSTYKPAPPGTRFGKAERVTGIPSSVANKGGPGPGTYKPLSCKPLGVSGINGFTKSTPMVNGRPQPYPNKNPPPTAYSPQNNFNDVLVKKGGSRSFGVAERFTPIISGY